MCFLPTGKSYSSVVIISTKLLIISFSSLFLCHFGGKTRWLSSFYYACCSQNVVAMETSYRMLEVFHFTIGRMRASIKITFFYFSGEKGELKLSGVSISIKVVGKIIHAIISKENMGMINTLFLTL